MTRLANTLKRVLNNALIGEDDTEPAKFEKWQKATKEFTKTEPFHSQRSCKPKSSCLWHSKRRTQ